MAVPFSSDSAALVCRVEDFRVFADQVLCSQLVIERREGDI